MYCYTFYLQHLLNNVDTRNYLLVQYFLQNAVCVEDLFYASRQCLSCQLFLWESQFGLDYALVEYISQENWQCV